MSERKLRIGVTGATGAVGREIVAMLGQVDLPVGEIVPMASPACTVHTVEIGGKNVRIENLSSELVASCDVVFMAVPPEVAGEPVRVAMDEGIPLVDLSGTVGPAQGVPLVVPCANRIDLQGFREHQAVASPRPDVVGLATLLSPLMAQAGDLRCRGTILHSAASAGRAGIEELSNQVVSLFNSRTPQRKVFERGLAFDLEPTVGTVKSSGWTDHELRCGLQVADVLGLEADRVAITSETGPWFNGICFALQIETDAGLDAAQVEEILAKSPNIRSSLSGGEFETPSPRSADGIPALLVGRVRNDPSGGIIHLWAAADELRFGAAGNALALLTALLEDDLI